MARIFTCGAEWNSVTEVGLAINGTSPTSAFGGAQTRSGLRGFSYSAASGATSFHSITLTGTAINRHYCLRIYLKRVTFASGMKIAAVLAGAGVLISARLGASGQIQLWNDLGAVQIGSDGPVLDTTRHVKIDLGLNVTDVANDHAYLFVDNVLVATSSTTNLATTAPSVWQFGCLTSPAAASSVYIDDIAINDGTAGGRQVAALNTPVLEGRQVLSTPGADTGRVGYVNGAGTTGSLFDAENNLPPTGAAAGTATNRIHSPTNNVTDTYDATMGTLNSIGVPKGAEITVIHLHANVGGASATADGQALRFTSNPVIAEGAVINKPAAAWGTYPTNWTWGFSSVLAYDPVGVDPVVSPVMRIRRATANASQLGADAMGAYVEYIDPLPSRPVVISQAVKQAANW